jgi:hypothetical protein
MKRTRLKPVSDKRKAENAQYAKAKRIWWKQHDGRCEMLFLPFDGFQDTPTEITDAVGLRCTRPAERNPHHMKLRGKFLCDITTFLGLCRSVPYRLATQ